MLQVERKIRSRVKRQMEKTQREYYLNEQLKAIQKELGEGEEGRDEMNELEERIRKTKLTQGSARKGDRRSEEASLDVADERGSHGRAQLSDWMLSLPWGKKSKVKQGHRRRREACCTTIISAWKRSRNASWNISRCSSAPAR